MTQDLPMTDTDIPDEQLDDDVPLVEPASEESEDDETAGDVTPPTDDDVADDAEGAP